MTMKKQYSYFDQLCALSYMNLCATHPGLARYQDVRRYTDALRNNH